MLRKYINELGRDDTLFNLDPNDKRWSQWNEEVKEYGFPSYETWSMDTAFYGWLYERLKMYVDVSCVELDYHKFEYEGVMYTQKELIDKMIRGCEIALTVDPNDDDKKAVEDVSYIWAIILPWMWW